jgi:hypothetical protein
MRRGESENLKSEIRNNLEMNEVVENGWASALAVAWRFQISDHLNLFRISDFGIRIFS